MPKYRFKGKKPFWLPYAVIGLVIALLLIIGALFARHTYLSSLKPLSSSENSQLITIETGSTIKQIADQLEDSGIIRKSWAFQWYVRNSDYQDELQAGTYSFKPSQSVQQIVSILTQGHIATDLVTILPGKRIDEIRDNLINSGFAVADVDAALNPANYANHPALADKPAEANLEGYLYPESFQRTAETKPQTIIRQSLDEMQKRLTPNLRAAFVAQGLTVHQGVILASIIENEVSKAEDRPKVAQVFYRRLREDIKLQSDATASYGAVLDGQEPSLTYDSIYNTYTHPGLTPGPISNVTESSLQAVASPASTDFLYFVSGDDGTTHFSHTLEEHQALTRQYCTELCN